MYIYLCLYFIINNFFLIKIKIFCIFPKFPGNVLENRKKNIVQILSYTKIYNSNYNCR